MIMIYWPYYSRSRGEYLFFDWQADKLLLLFFIMNFLKRLGNRKRRLLLTLRQSRSHSTSRTNRIHPYYIYIPINVLCRENQAYAYTSQYWEDLYVSVQVNIDKYINTRVAMSASPPRRATRLSVIYGHCRRGERDI